jgi:cytochrome c oxidase subunit 3/cytochrome o ubiquinol oxidase subunit 3
MSNFSAGSALSPTIAVPNETIGPKKGPVGMACLIAAESAIFTIFVVAYLFYRGKDLTGPTPAEVLRMPILNSVCLLSSSITIAAATRALRRGDTSGFARWWALTIALGGWFLVGTALEWRHLMLDDRFFIQTNLFGSTFYSLVGLHGSHVIVGLLALAIVLIFALTGTLTREHAERVHVVALYWHFVDVVWIVVFTVVYVL